MTIQANRMVDTNDLDLQADRITDAVGCKDDLRYFTKVKT
jgi:hypothetical protein